MRHIILTFICALFTIAQAHASWSLSSDGVLTITSNYEYSQQDYYPWYDKRESIKSIVLTDAVTSIGYWAFRGCTSLTSVTLPNSVTSIGEYAFSGCAGLTSVTLPNSVTSIGEYAFSGCAGLTSITIPNSVTSIGYSAFSDCTDLTNVIIGNSVKKIDKYTFSGCTSLASITIPNNVTKFVIDAFVGCTSLKALRIEDGSSQLKIEVYNDNYDWPIETLYIGRILKRIDDPNLSGHGAEVFWFRNLTSLKEVTIGKYVTSIYTGGELGGCPNLSTIIVDPENPNYDSRENCNAIIKKWVSIDKSSLEIGCKNSTIPNSVNGISAYAFSGCTGLTSITIPNSVTSISQYAFSGCTGLTSITIPNSVTSISQYAFSGCTELTSITIPNSVTSIGQYAFSGCSNLISVTIGKNVTNFGAYYRDKSDNGNYESSVFRGCTSLSKIVVEDGNTKYDSRNNCNAVIETSTNSLIVGCKNTTIPNSVTSFGFSAFSECTGLTSITIPNSVTSIGGCAFQYCTGLTSITIPNSVTSIGDCAFQYCKGLTSITIPNSVTSIGWEAFWSCSGLTSVTIPNSVTSIGSGAFSNLGNLKTIYSLHENEPQYYGFKNIIAYIPQGLTNMYKSIWGDNNTYIEVPCTELSYNYQNGAVDIVAVSDNSMTISVAPYDGAILECIYVDGQKVLDYSGLKTASITAQVNEDGTITLSGLSGTSVVEIKFRVINAASRATLTCDAQQGKVEVVSTISDVMTISIAPIEGNKFVGIYVDGKQVDGTEQEKTNEDGTISISGLTETSVVEVRFAAIATPIVNIKANAETAIAGVYSLTGQLLGKSTENLPKGVYIIVYTNGTSEKALVK